MSAETLAMVAGITLTLTFSYVPGLNLQYATLSPEYKRLIMLGLLVLIAAAAMGLACADPEGAKIMGIVLVCSRTGFWEFGRILILAIIANQGVFLISPEAKAVAKAKE